MIRRSLLTLGIAACAMVPAASQSLGLPVVNNGAATGISVAADIGFNSNDAGSTGTALGARASVGLGFFGVSAMISRFAPTSGDAIVAPGLSATLRLLGGPLVPFRITAQAGASRWTDGTATMTRVPLSIGLSATIPNPAFAIKPWIAPRLDILHSGDTSIEGDPLTSNEAHFGISGGVDVSLLNGISIRGAYDRTSTNAGGHASIFSLGLGFSP
jgi:hypothetical protein